VSRDKTNLLLILIRLGFRRARETKTKAKLTAIFHRFSFTVEMFLAELDVRCSKAIYEKRDAL